MQRAILRWSMDEDSAHVRCHGRQISDYAHLGGGGVHDVPKLISTRAFSRPGKATTDRDSDFGCGGGRTDCGHGDSRRASIC